MVRLAKWSIGSGIFIFFMKFFLAFYNINFLPDQPGEMTDFTHWLLKNTDIPFSVVLSMDITNSHIPWITGILVGVGLVMIFIWGPTKKE